MTLNTPKPINKEVEEVEEKERIRARDAMRKRRALHKKLGLCMSCKEKAANGRVLCERHLNEVRVRAKEDYKFYKSMGINKRAGRRLRNGTK
jgi:hypothetical protein